MLDLDFRFNFVNHAVRHTHGYEPEEMIGRPFTDFMAPEAIDRALAVAEDLKAGKPYFAHETFARTALRWTSA